MKTLTGALGQGVFINNGVMMVSLLKSKRQVVKDEREENAFKRKYTTNPLSSSEYQ